MWEPSGNYFLRKKKKSLEKYEKYTELFIKEN